MGETGWKRVAKHDVWLENGRVVRSVEGGRTVCPHKWRRGAWWNVSGGISPEAFRAGLRDGSVRMM